MESIVFETAGVVLLAIVGMVAGRWCSRLPRPYWIIAYFVPLAFVILTVLTRRFNALEHFPAIAWLFAGRTPFALNALIGTTVLVVPLAKLPQKRDRVFVFALMLCVVSWLAVWPFAAPAFNRQLLASLPTRVDRDGVCLQSTDYTCGPAAAVTALRKLGFAAKEGELAILAHTSNAIGTPPSVLTQTLAAHYAADGLVCEYRHFDSIDALPREGAVIALMKFALFIDHYVTVLDVTPQTVTVGDPLFGKTILSRVDFEKRWRFAGVVLNRAGKS
jgi:hypothetical protein